MTTENPTPEQAREFLKNIDGLANLSVQSLKELGFKIRITHRRYYMTWFDVTANKFHYELVTQKEIQEKKKNFAFHDSFLKHKGGETTVEISTPAGHQLVGVSKCRKDETYVRRIGRIEAIKHAFTDFLTPYANS